MEDERNASQEFALSSWSRYSAAALGFRNYWYPVMLARELGKKPRAIKICGEKIALFRDGDRVFALHDRCPHRGIPLSVGRKEAPGTISCAYHGWTYDLESGALVAVLTDGPDSPICGKVNVHRYPVEVRAGLIWLYVGDDPPPPFEDEVPEEFLRPNAVVEGYAEVRDGNWREAIENCIDEGHSKYLHRYALTTFWREAAAWTRGVDMVPSEDGSWLNRVRGETVVNDVYPRVGLWPRKKWWRKQLTGQSTQLSNRLPCYCRVGNPRSAYTSYQIFVPVDETRYLAMMLSVGWKTGLGALRFHLQQWKTLRWGKRHGFDPQDKWAISLMEIPPERLYRPDKSITGWRRWCHETARPQNAAERFALLAGGEPSPVQTVADGR
jgi:phenylpropionate dioxygenase-like ring-hydroxylating dioxygenase large terminal subunit